MQTHPPPYLQIINNFNQIDLSQIFGNRAKAIKKPASIDALLGEAITDKPNLKNRFDCRRFSCEVS